MRDGAMTALAWLVVAALAAPGVTAGVGVTRDLNATNDAGVIRDFSAPGGVGDAEISDGVMNDTGVTDDGDLLGWASDYFVAVDVGKMFDGEAAEEAGEEAGGEAGEEAGGEGEGACPRGCRSCGSEGGLRVFHCGGQQLKYTEDSRGSYMELVCHRAGVPLNCSRVPPLPARRPGPLQRVEVTSCLLPPSQPLITATGGEGTKELALQNALSSPTADNVRGLGAEELFLQFQPGACKEVPVEAIKALPHVRRARLLGGSSLRLHADMFLGAPPLTFLELSMSGVEELPSNAFRGLQHLNTLSLFLNSIASVAPDAFNGLDSLEKLVLNDNPLAALPTRALPPYLRVLLLERVALAELGEGVLGGLAELRQVHIESRAALRVRARAFSRLPSLAALRLTRSGVTSLPPDLFAGTPALVNLTLSYNKLASLPRELFSGLAALRRLDLGYNQLGALSGALLLPLAELTHLTLDGNRIRELPPFLFSSNGKLSSVSLAHNALAAVSADAFAGASALCHLSLSHNRLAWAPADAEYSSPFHSLTQLQTLDLSHNNISTIFSDWRIVLLQLSTLQLSHNSITALSPAHVQFLSAAEVDVRHNRIGRVEPRWWWEPDNPPAGNASFILDHNPFVCDCRLYDFLTLVQSGDKKFSVEGAACSAPAAVARQPLRRVDARGVACAARAAPGCACRTRPALQVTECTCNTTQVASAADSGYPEMALTLSEPPRAGALLRLPPFVRSLSLAGLRLRSVPALPTAASLRSLDLSRNLIETLPEQLWERNLTLRLAGNPLSCACAARGQLELLQLHGARVADYAALRCADGTPVRQRDAGAPCAARRAALLGTLLAAGVLLPALAAALLYRHRVRLQVFLHSRGWLLCLLPKEEAGADEPYDVFVAFAPEDERFVLREVLPRLRGYALLVQDRDWVAGNTIPAEIRRSVRASRRTLLVLSAAYLRGMWAPEQLRAEHARATHARRRRALVLLTDLRARDLDPDTRALLSLATLFRHDEPRLWDRLRYALPRRGRGGGGGGGGLRVVLGGEGKLVNQGYVKDV